MIMACLIPSLPKNNHQIIVSGGPGALILNGKSSYRIVKTVFSVKKFQNDHPLTDRPK